MEVDEPAAKAVLAHEFELEVGAVRERLCAAAARHNAPRERCGCGIYAADLETLASYMNELRTVSGGLQRVVGLVSLWGVVVECEHSWRAAHAYPAAIYVPTSRPDRGGGAHRARSQAASALTASPSGFSPPTATSSPPSPASHYRLEVTSEDRKTAPHSSSRTLADSASWSGARSPSGSPR
jgi:hypothetical protein